jgi:hypothetical protein
MTFDPEAYEVLPAVLHWLIVCGSCLGVILVISLVSSLFVRGFSGPGAVFAYIAGAIKETFQLSWRRISALAMLTVRDSIRRKSLYVFIVFAVLFMFAGWFLAGSNARPDLQVTVYVTFVLKAISWLILPVVLLLACWSLPDDIQARSLHTVVTKPARRGEVVLGRYFGFITVGLGVLVTMAAVGYIWILRQAPADANLTCRVPVYGTLAFLDREGNPGTGDNVGDEWMFRSYIEGATKSRGIFEFENVTPALLVDGKLRLESHFTAFRTRKGDIETKLLCELELVNPDTGQRYRREAFQVNEFGENITLLDRELTQYDEASNKDVTLDLFDDLLHDVEREVERDGKLVKEVKSNVLRIEARCIDPMQYLGMARPDLFIRTPDHPFWAGYVKSIAGIGLMMILVLVMGVTASCFCKGPVAALLTLTIIVVGQGFREFMGKLVSRHHTTTGPIESFVGILMHKNPGDPMEEGLAATIVQGIDELFLNGLWLVQQIIPDFSSFSRLSKYLPNGFDVDWNSALLPSIAVTLAYLLPCFLLGYMSLRLRELEAK